MTEETELSYQQIRKFANLKRALTRAIIHKSDLPTEIHPNPADRDEAKKIDTHIAQMIEEIPTAFLFPEEYNDTKEDWDKGLFQYHHSALHKAIKYADNKTAGLIIDKGGVMPQHFIIRGEVPSLDHAIITANEEISAKILAKVKDALAPQKTEQYKKDFIATFGENDLTDSIQSQPPADKAPAKKMGTKPT